MKRLLSALVFVTLSAPLVAQAQGLAEVAKKEEERRKQIKTPGKVYTNEDLKPDISTAMVVPPASPGSTTPTEPGTQVPALDLPAGRVEDDGAREEVRDEAYWRARIGAARSALERSRIFADSLQSRINALTTDFVNRDDPAQRAQIELERQRALAELERVKQEIAEQTQAIADIEEEARRAGVPPGWLR